VNFQDNNFLFEEESETDYYADMTLAGRIKKAMLMYNMMENSTECRRRIACLLGASLDGQSGPMRALRSALGMYTPPSLYDFKEELLRSNERRDCEQWSCSRCFSI